MFAEEFSASVGFAGCREESALFVVTFFCKLFLCGRQKKLMILKQKIAFRFTTKVPMYSNNRKNNGYWETSLYTNFKLLKIRHLFLKNLIIIFFLEKKKEKNRA